MGCLAWSVVHSVNRPLAVILNEVKDLSQVRGLLMASFACYKAQMFLTVSGLRDLDRSP
jgi:hypothetical protein